MESIKAKIKQNKIKYIEDQIFKNELIDFWI